MAQAPEHGRTGGGPTAAERDLPAVLIETSPDAVVLARLSDGCLLYANPQARRWVTGATHPTALVGRSLFALSPPFGEPGWRALVETCARNGDLARELELPAADGGTWWLELRLRRITFGNEDCVAVRLREITQRKRTELALRAKEQRLHELATAVNEVFWVSDPQRRRIEYVSPAYERLWGRSPESLYADPDGWFETIHPEDRARVREAIRAEQEGGAYNCEFRILKPDGTARWVHDQAFCVRGPDGRVDRIVGIARDITERMETRHELLAAKQFTELVLDSLPGIFYLFDEDGRMHRWNRLFERLTGYSGAEIEQMQPADFAAPEHRGYVEAIIAQVLASGEANAELALRAKDGTHLPCLVTGRRLVMDGHRYVLGTGIEIAERLAAEEALRRSEARYRSFVELTSEGVYSAEPAEPVNISLPVAEQITRFYANRVATCNDAMARMYGYASAADLVGMTLADLQGGTDKPENRAFLEHWIENDYRISGAISQEVDAEGNPRCFSNSVVGVVEDGAVVRIWGSQTDITERMQAEQALAAERQRLQDIIEATHVGTWEYNVRTGDFAVNERWAGMLGYALDELAPVSVATWRRLAHPGDRVEAERLLARHFAGELEHYQCELRMRHKHGHWVWVQVRGRLLSRTEAGEPLVIAGTHADVTERRQAEERLRLAASVFESTDEGVVITDAGGRILDVNRAFVEITGYAREELIGGSPRLLQSGRHDETFYAGMWRSITEAGRWRGELWNRRKDGSLYPQWLTISSVKDEAGAITHYVGVCSDISQFKRSQEQLDFLAHHDALTGLPNRLLLAERLEHALQRAERRRSQVAVAFLDVDHFKHINDSLGHSTGDELLKSVAQALVAAVRKEDTVARIGGDEFVLVLEDIGAAEEVTAIAAKLMGVFEESFAIEDQEIRVTPSIGICLYPRDGRDPDALLSNADAAMYRSKEEGRNGYHFYTEELTRKAFERVRLENGLRQAVARGELHLHYQPQLDLLSGAIVGVEALLRWRHPELGQISPARFIPLAEDSGLIGPIGRWVLQHACATAREWLDQGLAFGRVAVNIAGPQINSGKLPADVRAVLAETGLPADRLELEITESFIMQQAELAIAQLEELRELGVTLSIDDFGTGYSSLSYLKKLPIDKLKLDQSFVRDIPGDSNDAAISAAVIAMGHSLGLGVLAEGVETEAQLAFLAEHRCAEAQGYLFARPMPASEVSAFLAARPPKPPNP